MKRLKYFLLIMGIVTFSNSYAQEPVKSVVIGAQEWMVENLNVDKFRNGDPIPEAKSNEEWIKANQEKQPAWCYYENAPMYGQKYGKLYNWYAVNDPRGLAPEGWRIPSREDFEALRKFAGNDGNKLKAVGVGAFEGEGTDETGFSATMGGYRINESAYFVMVDFNAFFWSSTEFGELFARYMFLSDDTPQILLGFYGKDNGFSVRCIK